MNLDWLAGLIDGEGCFWIKRIVRKNGATPACGLTVQLREDDRATLVAVQKLTSLGKLANHNPPSVRQYGFAPSVKWTVERKTEVQKLAQLLEGRLHSKKTRDFELWRQAVDIHAAQVYGQGPDPRIWDLKTRLEEGRKYS